MCWIHTTETELRSLIGVTIWAGGVHPENNKAIYLEDNDRREKCGVSKEHGEGRLAQPEGGDSRAEPEQRVKVI